MKNKCRLPSNHKTTCILRSDVVSLLGIVNWSRTGGSAILSRSSPPNVIEFLLALKVRTKFLHFSNSSLRFLKLNMKKKHKAMNNI